MMRIRSKKETKIDENQEMSIDTSLIDLDNLAR